MTEFFKIVWTKPNPELKKDLSFLQKKMGKSTNTKLVELLIEKAKKDLL
jgi:hypothetical protein